MVALDSAGLSRAYRGLKSALRTHEASVLSRKRGFATSGTNYNFFHWHGSTSSSPLRSTGGTRNRKLMMGTTIALIGTAGLIHASFSASSLSSIHSDSAASASSSSSSKDTFKPFRHAALTLARCERIAKAVILDIIDYKRTFGKDYESEEVKLAAHSACHKRSAERVLEVLKENGGIYIKLGQHVASVYLLPTEWTSTMKPLQDQCTPTPFEDVKALVEQETRRPLDELFSEFSPTPIGVASLAQVHLARDRATGKKVAVKIQHPNLQEFAKIDIQTTLVALDWVKRFFPDFEFTWLGDEMQQNLPIELNFVHEAENTERARRNFADVRKTSLYIPEVLRATKRTLVMEFIEGARVDDLAFLAKHNIDRNVVSQEISRIFSRMVFLHGFFHADPHAGNLLIRPRSKNSRSPYNFEIALLDHGLYFDITDDLRINYAQLWLSLCLPSNQDNRRKYAELVGNIGPDLYPIFESAVTGRAGLEGTWDGDVGSSTEDKFPDDHQRASGMLDLGAQTEDEVNQMRTAMFEREGLVLSLFQMLRVIPRRVLMLFKMNDLIRSLDRELKTTHNDSRIFLITARFCSLAVWRSDLARFFDSLRSSSSSSSTQRSTWSLLRELSTNWWKYHFVYDGLRFVEWGFDVQARMIKLRAWLGGLRGGLRGAHDAAAGLA